MQSSAIEPEGLFDGLHWRPIVRWAALDVVLTLVLIVPVVFYLAGAEALSDDEETATQAIDAAVASPDLLLWSFVLGLSITVYASFRASRAAGTLHLRHGGWTAVVSAVLGFLLLLVTGGDSSPANPLWYDALSLGLMVPAGVLGGWLASREVESAT